MKTRLLMMLVCIMVLSVITGYGQMVKRTDAIWARVSTAPITLDGKLSEAAWATAESIKVHMGEDSGIPGGGWYWENGIKPGTDPTDATVKFLVQGDSLYVGLVVKDKSIGGGLFNHFDGFISNVRYKQADGFQKTPFPQARTNQACELFWGWVTEPWAGDSLMVQKSVQPGFYGDFGDNIGGAYVVNRPDSLKAFWDAVATVQGITNDDATPDTGYTVEVKINLKQFNYNVTQPAGDIVMWSMSIYDADYQWPVDTLKQSGNRVWIQCPWSNASAYNHLRIFTRPDVTTGALPTVGPDYVIPDGKNFATPVLDGKLTEPIWKYAGQLPIQYGNGSLRNSYANTAKWRSGQFQPTVNGAQNPVVDPDMATVKYFFKGDTLYLGFDVQDQFVQYVNDYDRWDGFRVVMEQRDARNGDSVLAKRRFTFRIDSLGTGAIREDDLSLSGWDSLKTAVTVALALKGGTTIDTVGSTPDSGYTAEMKISLQKMGYPADRGDGVVFLSVTHMDGDSYAGGSYGTRTWFMREGDFDDGAAWMYMDPTVVASVTDKNAGLATGFALLGNYPNPFNPSTTIKFTMSRSSEVTMSVYDVLGRMVSSKSLGTRTAGLHEVVFDASSLSSGTYYYRLKAVSTGATLVGKMMLLK